MPVIDSTYHSKLSFLGGHVETIYPYLFRKIDTIKYRRQRIDTPDNDFLDLDWSYTKKDTPQKRLAILSHGLEGNSHSQYILGHARLFNQKGWDALAWNHRGCSGEVNRKVQAYHSGSSYDLETIVNHVLENHDYQEIVLIGYSLSGNLTLKYLGEQGDKISPKIKKAIAYSVPLHLVSCAKNFERWENWLYSRNFLKSLCEKVRRKSRLFPKQINTNALKGVRTLRDFDEAYTAPIHGFKNALHYYESCSSIYFLENITIPTLIINAQNDSFLSKKCYPKSLINKFERIFMEMPKGGGHCGFGPRDKYGFHWSEWRSWKFATGA